MAHIHHFGPGQSQLARHRAWRRLRHVGQPHANLGWRERAHVVASLVAAEQALPAEPDAAALLLDGSLSELLALWAQQAHISMLDRRQALAALDDCAPIIAGRVRLALQAHQPEARLAHCWALLELLTTPTATQAFTALTPSSAHDQIARQYADSSASRKNGESHVS